LIAPLSIFNGYTILANESLAPVIAEMDEVSWMSDGLPDAPEINNDSNRTITRAESFKRLPTVWMVRWSTLPSGMRGWSTRAMTTSPDA
jgi:hypothetical protein